MKRVHAWLMVMVAMCTLVISPRLAHAEDAARPPEIDLAQDIDALSLPELRLLRNTVFAVHGREFEAKDLQDHFWKLPWYQQLRRGMERAGRRYQDSSLDEQEKAFVQRIRDREDALGREARPGEQGGARLYDLEKVANARLFPRLAAKPRSMLEQNGFLVLPAKHQQFFAIYEDNEYRSIPSFITSDAVLQLYHAFFDFALRDLETHKLHGAAMELAQGMRQRAAAELSRARSPERRRALELAVVYFAVAEELFTGKPVRLAGRLDPIRKAEVAAVRARSEARSALLGYGMDYTFFTPRGHYTRSAVLKRYFLGMTWFGMMMLDVRNEMDIKGERKGDQLLASLEITRLLDAAPALRARWETIYEPTAFLVGPADDLSPEQVREAMVQVAGAVAPPDELRLDDAVAAKLREALAKLSRQRIHTSYLGRPNAGFCFMGVRTIPDSEMFQQLIDPEAARRPFPKGLDLFAVLGHAEAARLLDEHYKEPERWEDYLPHRRKLQAQYAALPASDWEQNVYWSWIDSLRVLTGPAEEGAPPFAHTRAWQLKQLHTGLASWAELRHDTILYAKPSGAECGGDEPPVVRGYVEPVPRFFARLNRLLEQTRDGLGKRGLLTESFRASVKQMEELLRFLETVARKEVAGEKVTAGEYEQIRLFGANLEGLTAQLLTGYQGGRWYEVVGPDRSVAVIADVSNAGASTLEEGVGNVGELFVIVEVNGIPTLTRGGVFSYYEFEQPASNRLTDEAWQKLLEQGKAPPPPDWIEEFQHPELCPAMPNVGPYTSGC